MSPLFHAHSGLRYLVLLAGVIALAYVAYALLTRRPVERAERLLTAIYVGTLDLQILLGIVLVATGLFYPALMGHLVMMILAALVAHGASALAKRAADAHRAHTIRLVGVLVSLGLIVAGVAAIGRSLLGSGAPTSL